MANNITRRTFLKLSGAAAATAAVVGTGVPKKFVFADAKKDVKRVKTTCEMCSVRCALDVTIENGKVTYVTGNGAAACARGAASVSQLYDDQRVKKPLIRAGERGENKWKEVSWDEAYDYIAEKMQEIKQKYGPEAMAFSCRGGIHKKYYMDTFANAYGSPNTFTHESTCPFGRTVARNVALGANSFGIDYANVKYLISMGRNYFEAINVGHAKGVMTALKKGAKLIYLDPRFSVTASKADRWYPVKPGTDLAFIMALTHVIVRDKLYNKDFLDKYTVGFDKVVESVKAATPEWAEKETGIPAKDIEQIAKDFAKAAPSAVVDWGWRTGTSKNNELALRRASINLTMLVGSFEVPGGITMNKPAAVFNKLIGSEVIPTLKSPKLPAFPKLKPRVDGAGVKGHPHRFAPKGDGVVHYLPEAILTGKPYPIKGWFVYRNNPMISQSNVNRVKEALLKLDLLVVCDLWITDTGHLADVILPESTFLERNEGLYDSSGGTPKYQIRQQAVKPLYDTKSNWEIFHDLADKMGLSAYFPWKDLDEWQKMQTSSHPELLAKLKENGVVTFGLKSLYLRDPKSVAAFVAKYPTALSKVTPQGTIDEPLFNLKTPSKKVELFSQQVEDQFPGFGVPNYIPETLKEDNELYFLQGKVAVHTNAHTHNIPWLNELMPKNSLWLNPATAKKRGLSHGDKVEITSEYGKQPGTVLVSKGIREDSVFTYFGFGRQAPGMKRANGMGTNSNIMLPTYFMPVCCMALHTVGIEIKKV